MDYLITNENGKIFYSLAISCCHIKEYGQAQEYALKAIECKYDKAYFLYTKITIEALNRLSDAIDILVKGVEQHSSAACYMFALLYSKGLDTSYNEDIYNSFLADKLLELSFKYAKDDNKGLLAYHISAIYKNNLNNKEKSIKYVKLSYSYA